MRIIFFKILNFLLKEYQERERETSKEEKANHLYHKKKFITLIWLLLSSYKQPKYTKIYVDCKSRYFMLIFFYLSGLKLVK
jgi:hypothetical protein